MPQNFISCDRDQQLMMPPDLNEWLPADHLVWFVIDSVAEMDLSAFYAEHRDDGWGRAAYEPRMMVTLLLYAYAKGIRSAREIERRCVEDVAFRVITTGHQVDHATICRFRTRHRTALADLFVGVLDLCSDAGMVHTEVVAIDGTKLAANASSQRNVTREQLEDLARRVFDEAERIDAQEDELYGDRRGDEIPGPLVDKKSRVEWIKRRLKEREGAKDDYEQRMAQRAAKERELGHRLPGRKPKPARAQRVRVNTTDPDSAVQRTQQGFIQGYNGQIAVTEDQVIVAADLISDNNDCDQLEPMITQVKDNLKTTEEPIGTVVADAGYFSDDNMSLELEVGLLIAPVSTRNLDKAIADRTEPITVGQRELERWETERSMTHRRAARREAVMDAYAAKQVTVIEAAQALGVSVAHVYSLAYRRKKFGSLPRAKPPSRPPRANATEVMLQRFAQPGALKTYGLRGRTVEPVFGQIKEARAMRRFLHRGLPACRCEWRMMAAAHNLRKLWGQALENYSGSARSRWFSPVVATSAL